jgi:hypothetical protein
MRSLKPITTLLFGPLLLAMAVSIAGAVADPGLRNPRGILIGLGIGMALGLLIFIPIAASDAFRWRFVRRHFQQFDDWSAFLLAMGLGHCVFLQMGDWSILAAFAAIFVGALVRQCLSQIHRF